MRSRLFSKQDGYSRGKDQSAVARMERKGYKNNTVEKVQIKYAKQIEQAVLTGELTYLGKEHTNTGDLSGWWVKPDGTLYQALRPEEEWRRDIPLPAEIAFD